MRVDRASKWVDLGATQRTARCEQQDSAYDVAESCLEVYALGGGLSRCRCRESTYSDVGSVCGHPEDANRVIGRDGDGSLELVPVLTWASRIAVLALLPSEDPIPLVAELWGQGTADLVAHSAAFSPARFRTTASNKVPDDAHSSVMPPSADTCFSSQARTSA